MTIYAIRHADKEAGEFRTRGLPLNDQPINETGRARALKLVDFFEAIEIDSIKASQYLRTTQTIQAVADRKRIEIKIDPRLNETNIGDVENLTDEEIMKTYPQFWQAFLARDRDFRFPNGENGEEAGARIYEVFNSLPKTGSHILVAHDGIIRTLICKVLKLPVYQRHLFRMDYCGITSFDFSDQFNCWMVTQINHLV